MRPSNDHEAIELILKGITEKGIILTSVYDGEEDEAVATVEDAVKILDNLDDAFLHVVRPDGDTGWIRFVMGNEPEEVVSNHTINLSEWIDPIVDPWWK